MRPRYDEGDLACTTVSSENFSELEALLVSTATCFCVLTIDHLGTEARLKTPPDSKMVCDVEGKRIPSVPGQAKTDSPAAPEGSDK